MASGHRRGRGRGGRRVFTKRVVAAQTHSIKTTTTTPTTTTTTTTTSR
jgi:hypothetical protein